MTLKQRYGNDFPDIPSKEELRDMDAFEVLLIWMELKTWIRKHPEYV
jgi:hypothetical protein